MQQRCILCADPDPELRSNLGFLLAGENCVLEEAAGGATLLTQLRRNTDLVILPQQLPDMSGFDACTALRRQSAAPVLFLLEKADESAKTLSFSVATWAECISRAFTAYGAGRSDIFQVSYGYGLFTGGLGAHAGAENIGASVIPMSSGNTEKQITLMHDFGSTVLCCTPSYALYLADAIKDSGLPREEFQLKVGAFGAEPWTENMRHEIEEKLGIKAYDIYGLSEIAGPGVGYECECQHGTHLNEDHYFPEIIDPNTLQPVESGQTGELVFTHLTKEGMPLLRYRTRDLTALHHDKCSCGRTLVRMDRILGRSDDMLIIRGVNVFPTQIESVILEMEEFEPHYLLIVGRENNTDTMELQVEVRPEFYSDEINKMLALKKKLGGRLQSVLGLGVNVKLVEPRSIERSVGKAKRVIDNRKI